MKSKKPPASDIKTPVIRQKDGSSPLNLTPAQARREAEKLREFGEGLKDRKKVDDTSARTSPLGRAE